MDDTEGVMVEITDNGIRLELLGIDEAAASALLYRAADYLLEASKADMVKH